MMRLDTTFHVSRSQAFVPNLKSQIPNPRPAHTGAWLLIPGSSPSFTGGFLPSEEQKRHSRESGNPTRDQWSWVARLDARLRGHDGLALSYGRQIYSRCGTDEKPTRMRSPSRGFTLIEIMVVVFILGLLATLIMPKVMGRTDEAKRTKAAADLRALQQALNLYRLDNGAYPTTEQGLQALVSKPQTGSVPVRWNPEGYLEKVQTDPWGHPYVYVSNGERYLLKSLGADGEEGGEGKYADLDSRDL